jgi:amylosucrase
MTLSSNSLKAMLDQLPFEQHAQFIERFQQQSPVLLERLQALYGDGENFSDWFMQLIASVADLAAARPAALRELDQQRQQDKDWFGSQNMLGYCSYVDHFAGDLNGVIKKIPHLTEMGVRYLHLLPFLRARVGENDGGFAVSSFSEIEPRFGSMADLRNLTGQLREKNISLCSDFILNHVADDHPWALAAKAGEPRYRDYFYCYQDRAAPDKFEQTLGQVFPQAAPGNFTYIDSLQRWVWTTFYPYQWDLNYTNPAVFAEMVIALLGLANQGIEVFRLDSTAFLWKREGSNCMNQPEAHWILQALRCIVDIAAPGVVLKAEAIVPTAELPAYLGSKDADISECHLAYHSSLMAAGWAALAEQDTGMIKRVMQATPTLPEQTSWLTYVRCHDDIGWNVLRAEAQTDNQDAQQRLSNVSRFFAGEDNSFARGASFQAADPTTVHGSVGMASALCGYSSAHNQTEIDLARKRMLLLYGLALTFGGLPVIYMGDELAQGNDDTYRQFPAKAKDSRWLQRPDLDQAAYNQKNQPNTESGQIFADLCRMFSCRRNSPQLAANQQRHLIPCDQPELLLFARGDLAGRNALYFVGNFSERTVTLDLQTLNEYAWIDVLTVQTYRKETTPMLVVPPYGQFWLRQLRSGESA